MVAAEFAQPLERELTLGDQADRSVIGPTLVQLTAGDVVTDICRREQFSLRQEEDRLVPSQQIEFVHIVSPR